MAYGLNVYNSSGDLIHTLTDKLARCIYTCQSSTTSSETFTIPDTSSEDIVFAVVSSADPVGIPLATHIASISGTTLTVTAWLYGAASTTSTIFVMAM